jgi:hypothetical protein
MALHFEPRDHPTQVSVVTEAHQLLTDSARLEHLFNDGYKFEAAAAQALVIEAMSTMYLLLHHQALGRPILDEKGRNTELSAKATFGRVVSLIGTSGAYHTDTIEADLRRYANLRNELVHEMSGSSLVFDLDEFFRLGVNLVASMKPHFLNIIGRIEQSRGQGT